MAHKTTSVSSIQFTIGPRVWAMTNKNEITWCYGRILDRKGRLANACKENKKLSRKFPVVKRVTHG